VVAAPARIGIGRPSLITLQPGRAEGHASEISVRGVPISPVPGKPYAAGVWCRPVRGTAMISWRKPLD